MKSRTLDFWCLTGKDISKSVYHWVWCYLGSSKTAFGLGRLRGPGTAGQLGVDKTISISPDLITTWTQTATPLPRRVSTCSRSHGTVTSAKFRSMPATDTRTILISSKITVEPKGVGLGNSSCGVGDAVSFLSLQVVMSKRDFLIYRSLPGRDSFVGTELAA